MATSSNGGISFIDKDGNGTTVLRNRVPATSAMLLKVAVNDQTLAHCVVTANGVTLGGFDGPSGIVDLRSGAPASRMYVDWVNTNGATGTLYKDTNLMTATAEDEEQYSQTPKLYLGECRVAYADLERITGAEALARGTVTGALIAGPIVGVVDLTDCVVEARSSVETMTGGKSSFTRCVISGLEREDDGTPLRIHRNRQLLNGGGYTVVDTVLEWTNDGHSNMNTSTYRGGVIGPHLNYIYRGDRQHPDGGQGYGKGGVDMDGTLLLGGVADVPLGRDGLAVPFTGVDTDKNGKTWGGPAGAAGIMLNTDQPTLYVSTFRNVRSRETASVHFNFAGASGRTLPDGSPAVVADNCIVEKLSPNRAVYAGNGNWAHAAWPSPDADYRWGDGSSRYGDLGPSTRFRIFNDDGTERYATRREIIF